MNAALRGRHALVCGASTGIGRASALALARMGAEITALARSESRLTELCVELEAAGSPIARALVADLDDRPGLETKVGLLVADHPVQVLVNNTGGPSPGPLLAASEADLLHAFGRHVLASHLLVRLCLPGMTAAGWGRVINVVSLSVREPIPNLGVSNTVRGAMASWAKTLSRELPPDITINNVLPGYTATERLDALARATARRLNLSPAEVERDWVAGIPERRLGRPDELAAVIAFLASPAASYIRGTSIPVDGGRLGCI